MKVAIVNSYDKINVRLRNEIDSLQSAGYNVDVFLLGRGNTGVKELTFDIKELNVNIFRINLKLMDKQRSSLLLCVPEAYSRLIKIFYASDYDVIHVCHPVLLPLGLIVGRITRCKVVYDCFELHSLSLSYRFKIRTLRPFIKKGAQYVESILVKYVDGILTIDTAYDYLYNIYNKRNNNIASLNNVPDPNIKYDNELFGLLQSKYQGKKIVSCIGGISRDKCVEEIVKAAYILRPEFPEILFLFIGRFRDNSKDRIESYIRQVKLEDNIQFIDWERYHRMLSYLAISHVGLALYRSIPQYFLSRGNARRIFTYMSVSLPMLVSDFGELGKVVHDRQCGILVDPISPEKIAKSLRYIFRTPQQAKVMGENGNRAIKEAFNWETEQKKMLAVYGNMFIA